MFLLLEERVREAFVSHVRHAYGVEVAVVVEQPREPQFGELAVPVAFGLAKQLRKPPRKIAEEIIAAMAPIPGVAKLEVAGGG